MFDTTGVVHAADGQLIRTPDGGLYPGLGWGFFDAFTQDCMRALLKDAWGSGEFICQWWDRRGAYGDKGPVAFSDFAPETLERIAAACANAQRVNTPVPNFTGGEFWAMWQAGRFTGMDPAAPSIGADGKVHLREAA